MGMTQERESLLANLREKAGDGSTDYFVEVRQSDLIALLDAVDELPVLGHCPHGVDLDREFCPKGCRV